jgi:hypothetical protein
VIAEIKPAAKLINAHKFAEVIALKPASVIAQ